MNTICNRIFIAAILAFIAVGAALLTANPVVAQGTGGPRVTVINRDTEPVPAKVVNSVPLQVTVTGPVTLPEDNRTPVSFAGEFTVVADERVASESAFTVPDGKRLVIEYVTFRVGEELVDIEPDAKFNFQLRGGHTYDIGTVETEEDEMGSMSLATKILFDENTAITARIYRGGIRNLDVLIKYSAAGYLEDM